jgi:hypothetical protein
MQTVRYGDIDGVDAGVREQFRVRAVRRGNPVLGSEPASAFTITCRDGNDLGLRVFGRGLHYGDRCDPRRPENAEADPCPGGVARGAFRAFLMGWFRYHVTPGGSRNLGEHYAHESPGRRRTTSMIRRPAG